jgi:Lar family restriction alleviation protein
MSEKLLPCPFCGESNARFSEYVFRSELLCVRCRHCDARGPYTEYGTEEKAAILWNCRVNKEADDQG